MFLLLHLNMQWPTEIKDSLKTSLDVWLSIKHAFVFGVYLCKCNFAFLKFAGILLNIFTIGCSNVSVILDLYSIFFSASSFNVTYD